MKKNHNFNQLSPAEQGFHMPAEWALHSRCWMAWPGAHVQWENLSEVEQGYANVANAIAQFEPVAMVADPANSHTAEQLCGDNVEIISMPLDDSWMRDSGPSFVRRDSDSMVAGIDWRFNAWGGAFSKYQQDAQTANRILDDLDMEIYHSSLVFEGGAFHVDGEGTLVTTESVVLNPNRNYGMDKKQAEIELCRATGATKIIWLPGDLEGDTTDMTDGHVDGIMCFIKPGVVLVERDADSNSIYAELERENRRALELAKDAKGRNLEVIDLVADHSGIGEGFDLFCNSFINFYLLNGGLVMPNYGTEADNLVRDQLAQLFPDRKIVSVDINAIAPGGGGIHCITQQQPS